MAGRSKISGAESRESIRAPTAATACRQKYVEKKCHSDVLGPGDDIQAQLREGFHPCSPRAGAEEPGPKMQADGLPEIKDN